MELGGALETRVQDQGQDFVLHSEEPMKSLREEVES